MIAIDTNVLVHAHRGDAPSHTKAKAAIQTVAETDARFAIPWPCLYEFLAVVTHARVFKPPTPLAAALAQVDAWLASPGASLLAEDETAWADARRVLTAAGTTGAQVHDAKIAALCLRHGVREFWTADRDFSRFPSLRTRNPLV